MGSIWIFVLNLCVLALHRGGRVAGRPTQCLTFRETMTTCMSPVGGSPLQPGGGHELLSDLNTTKTLCSEGKLQEAMTCLEEVYNECVEQSKARNQQSSDLDLMLDVGKWRRGMEKLCDNVDYLMEHSLCTEKIATQSSHCIRGESKQFQKAIASLNLNLNTLNPEERAVTRKKIMDQGCSFAVDVIWCFKTPLDREDSCPCRYRQLVIDVVAESMPPYCKIDTDYYYDEYYLETCEEKEKKEREKEAALDTDQGGVYDDDNDDLEDMQYGGYSFADPSKVKVFEEGEFVHTNLFPGYGHEDYRDPGQSGGLQQDPQSPDSPPGGTGRAYTAPEMGKSQDHKGMSSRLSTSFSLPLSAAMTCALLNLLHW
ncbi:uncharacterized protein LOC143299389 [Babylonia areolata]|uniref:uncharacterized protein LOC143299389 n=1 Tax=Babylonia areolata TaxID=304850 RepID=UPI003FCEFD70